MYRVKRTLQPLIEGDKIIFGSGNSSIEQSLPNTTELRNFLYKLDRGVRLSELSSAEKYIFRTLIDKGLITENNYDNNKYSRNLNFFEWLDTSSNTDPSKYQKIINNSTILIVGLGGIGGTVAEILSRMGIGHLILVDYDVVDESNLTRQSIYASSDIHSLKINAAKSYLSNISNVKITTVNKKINSSTDLSSLFSKYTFDLSICCADTPKIEIDYWFDEVSHKMNRPYIIGSYASTVINRACIIPGKTTSLKDFYGEYMIDDSHLLDSEIKTSIIAPISYMSAGMIAYAVMNYLTQLNHKNKAIQIDLLDWTVAKYDLS